MGNSLCCNPGSNDEVKEGTIHKEDKPQMQQEHKATPIIQEEPPLVIKKSSTQKDSSWGTVPFCGQEKKTAPGDKQKEHARGQKIIEGSESITIQNDSGADIVIDKLRFAPDSAEEDCYKHENWSQLEEGSHYVGLIVWDAGTNTKKEMKKEKPKTATIFLKASEDVALWKGQSTDPGELQKSLCKQLFDTFPQDIVNKRGVISGFQILKSKISFNCPSVNLISENPPCEKCDEGECKKHVATTDGKDSLGTTEKKILLGMLSLGPSSQELSFKNILVRGARFQINDNKQTDEHISLGKFEDTIEDLNAQKVD